MHFTWDITFGQVVVSVPILWIVGMLMKMHGMLLRFRIEHEDLMADWAKRQNPPRLLSELPTRQSKWW